MYLASIVWHDAFETHLGRYVTHVLFLLFLSDTSLDGWVTFCLSVFSGWTFDLLPDCWLGIKLLLTLGPKS